MKLWYYPSVPLEWAKPSTECEHLHIKFGEHQKEFGIDIVADLQSRGQLNPNIARWNSEMWAIEPGQSRWFAMRQLGIKTQKVLFLADTTPFPDLENWEIVTRRDAEEVFQLGRWEDHTGLGYLRRRRLIPNGCSD